MFGGKHVRLATTLLVPTCVSLMVLGCARVEIKTRAVSYNKALSDFGNKQILINAVRASKRFSMYFAALGDLTGKESVSGTVAQKFPFRTDRRNKLPTFNLDPTLSVSPGISSFTVGNLNQAEFLKRIQNEIDRETFKLFFDNDWAQDVIFNIFTHKFTVDSQFDKKIGEERMAICARRDSFWKPLCNIIEQDIAWLRQECRIYYDSRRKTHHIFRRTYFNSGRNRCALINFQTFVREIRILGPEIVQQGSLKEASLDMGKMEADPAASTMKTAAVPTWEKGFEKKKIVIKKTEDDNSQTETTLEPKQEDKTLVLTLLHHPYGKLASATKLQMDLRSPYAMIYYLGQIIAAQLYVDEPFKPTVAIGRAFKRVPLFEVRQSIVGKIVGVVSVRHEGRTFYIPRPKYGKLNEARSLESLELINQAIVQQTNRDDLPRSSNFNLIATR